MDQKHASRSSPGVITAYVRHLRLPFQLTLAPLFLWGLFLAGLRSTEVALVAFVSLHLLLYPGVTAFNSVYDRDSGPVSFMRSPPPVPPGLLGVSLAMQVVGAALAASLGLRFLMIYLAIAALAAGYSHPALRWKACPWKSAVAVARGQGGLGFLAGWTAGQGGQTAYAMLGFSIATLTTLGLYPLTQVFQVEEDAARGDRTLGPAVALRVGALALAGAGALMAVLAY